MHSQKEIEQAKTNNYLSKYIVFLDDGLALVHTWPSSYLNFFPYREVHLFIIKNNSISCCPNHPTSCDEDLPENSMSTKFDLAAITMSNGGEIEVPIYRDRVPAGLAEITFKEKVETSFFMTYITKHTSVVLQDHVFPSQHISCVQSISE